MPVIVHDQRSFDSLKSSIAASVHIGKKVFYPTGSYAGVPLRGLPSDWRLAFLKFEIPLRAVRPEFTAVIRYTQPHLPGAISAYYPIRPPEAPAAQSIVRYTPADSDLLVLLSKRLKVVETRPTRVAVRPENEKLILVRAIPNTAHSR